MKPEPKPPLAAAAFGEGGLRGLALACGYPAGTIRDAEGARMERSSTSANAEIA